MNNNSKRKAFKRLDRLLVERKIAPNIKEAYSLIMSGKIKIDGDTVRDPKAEVENDTTLSIERRRYVSRGGDKLEGALEDLGLDVSGYICADIGISTGGFTDCLLKHGAKRVYGFDVGFGVVDYSLRKDKRLILFERCNFREFDTSLIKEMVALIVIDVSFISVKRIIPNALKILSPHGRILTLVKPQFEVERGLVGKGGIVRDGKIIENLIREMSDYFRGAGFKIEGITPSRLKGRDGNQEYFFLLKR